VNNKRYAKRLGIKNNHTNKTTKQNKSAVSDLYAMLFFWVL